MNRSYLIATAIPNTDNMDAMKEYSSAASELIKKAGGNIYGRFKIKENLLGEIPANSILIAEFPNDESIVSLIESEAYKNIISKRNQGFKDITIHIGHKIH